MQAAKLCKEFPNIEFLAPSSNFAFSFSRVFSPRVRSNLMIQDGCEHFCSYCIVPYARGKIKSKPLPQIIKEAIQLIKAGAREIVLTGINLGAYGSEIRHHKSKGKNLSSVIRHLSSLDSLNRLRLSSLEPMYLSQELIDEAISNPKVCDHFHIPLQSGDNSILRNMNRKYTNQDYLEIVKHIRKRKPDCAITTDIIVGFPGEGQKEFQNTIDLVNKVKFSRIHVFTFSNRKGTPAASFPDQVEPSAMKERSKTLHKLRTNYMIEFANKYQNKEVEILVEQKGEGLTPNFIRVLYPGHKDEIGKLKKLRIKEVKEEFCLGC
jgi:threonylcarbamoyladenosine tRNA methylthiotransferase MtaB